MHKLFEIIGERAILLEGKRIIKEGIFLPHGNPSWLKPNISLPDFLRPVYNPSKGVEDCAKGVKPFRERINPENPVLSFHFAVDSTCLDYVGKRGEVYAFQARKSLVYEYGEILNDGHFEIFNQYVHLLEKAGFLARFVDPDKK